MKPNISHLRVFRSICFKHSEEEVILQLGELKERRSKRTERSFDKLNRGGDTLIGRIKGKEIEKNIMKLRQVKMKR